MSSGTRIADANSFIIFGAARVSYRGSDRLRRLADDRSITTLCWSMAKARPKEGDGHDVFAAGVLTNF